MSIPSENHSSNTRQVFENLLAGNPPNGIRPEDCGRHGESVQAIFDAHERGGHAAVKKAFASLAAADPELAALVAGDEPEPKRYTVHWASEAAEPEPPPVFVIEGIFQEGSLNLVVGDPGSFKTWILLDAAVAVAMGGSWLEREILQRGALIVDEESGGRRLRRRLRGLMRGCHAPLDLPLAYVTLEQFDFRKDEDAGALKDLINETQAGFVIVDTLAAIMPGADENAVKDVQPLFMRLRKVAEETGAAIVLIHHSGKNGTYRGSSAILGAVDLMLKVESSAESGMVELTSEKTRDVEPFTLAAHVRFEEEPEFKVFVSPAEKEIRQPKLSAGEEYVLRYLREHGAATVPAITDSADTCSASTARKAVYSLASRCRIYRTDQGGPGSEATYDLVESKPAWHPVHEFTMPYKD